MQWLWHPQNHISCNYLFKIFSTIQCLLWEKGDSWDPPLPEDTLYVSIHTMIDGGWKGIFFNSTGTVKVPATNPNKNQRAPQK